MRLGLLALSVIGLCAACGSDTATSPLAPTPLVTPTAVGAYQGTWTGQTSQSGPFGFVVTGEQVTRLDFNVSFANISCLGGLSSGLLGPVAAISNAEFSRAYTNPSGDLTWSVEGTFVSATMATGIFQVTTRHTFPADPMSACSPSVQVTWVARKGA
jgi:hypothetical protein